MSIKEIGDLVKTWEHFDGDGDFRSVDSLQPVLDHLVRPVKTTRFRWPVASVDIGGGGVKLRSGGGDVVAAAAAVIAVPINILKTWGIKTNLTLKGHILLTPPPKRKGRRNIRHRERRGEGGDGLNSQRMDLGMKLFFKFSKQFWPADVHGVTSVFWPSNS